MADEDRAAKVRQADSKAMAALRDKYRAEFHQFKVGFASDLGIEWAPPLTEEERAREQMLALAEHFPDIAQEVLKGATSEDLAASQGDGEG